MGEDTVKLEYKKLAEEYIRKYGDRTILLFEIGIFFEYYEYLDVQVSYDIAYLSELLQINPILSENRAQKFKNCPDQLGIHKNSLAQKLKTLCADGFTAVVYTAYTNSNKKKSRKLDRIYTKETFGFLDILGLSSYSLSLYIVDEECIGSNVVYKTAGMVLADYNTGKLIVYDFFSDKNDSEFATNEINRIMETYMPKKVLVAYETKLVSEIESLKKLIESYNSEYIIDDISNSTDYKIFKKEHRKINYQNEILSKIYGLNKQYDLNGGCSPIEKLKMEKLPYSTVALVLFFDYTFQIKSSFDKISNFPEQYHHTKHLLMGNSAIQQLNVIDSNNLETYHSKITSLYDAVNYTKTAMGKRYLINSLCTPLSSSNTKKIQQRYDCIEYLITNDLIDKFQNKLKHIKDIEKLLKKIPRSNLVPSDLSIIDETLSWTLQILKEIKNHPILHSNLELHEIQKDVETLHLELNNIFNIKESKNYSDTKNIFTNIFKKKYNKTFDKLQSKIDYNFNAIKTIQDTLNLIFLKNKKLTSKINEEHEEEYSNFFELEQKDNSLLPIKYILNSRGSYLHVSESYKSKIKDYFKSNKIVVNLDEENKITIKENDINIKKIQSKNILIIDKISENIDILNDSCKEMSNNIFDVFSQVINDFYLNNFKIFYKMIKFISNIDFIVSGAKCAFIHKYTKPLMVISDKSYIKTEKLRHAFREQLIESTEYVPIDIDIGNNSSGKNGILLFGANYAGKSALMKSVGLAIILAQIGYFVPASTFEYSPYDNLYTRINGNDNIIKGQSLFSLEVTEIDTLSFGSRTNGPKTLVIGDEVCRGTESNSGVSIVAGSIIYLCNKETTFIFSSHLHELCDLDQIVNLKNLKICHMEKIKDNLNNRIIYTRKLKDGEGPRDYGYEFAECTIKNKELLDIITNIHFSKNEKIKTSNYNTKKIMSNCEICGYRKANKLNLPLESHHIIEQYKYKIGKNKTNIRKNNLCNLVALCTYCHDKVDNNTINILGYMDTIDGPVLHYTLNYNIQ